MNTTTGTLALGVGLATAASLLFGLNIQSSENSGDSAPTSNFRLVSETPFQGNYIDVWSDGAAIIKVFGGERGVAPSYSIADSTKDGRQLHSASIGARSVGTKVGKDGSLQHPEVSLAEIAEAMGEPPEIIANQQRIQQQNELEAARSALSGQPPLCAAYNNGDIHTYGCDSETIAGISGGRYYLAHKFQVSGWSSDTSWWFPDRLKQLKATDVEPSMPGNQGSGQGLYQWSPGSTSNLGSCQTKTYSVTVYGIGYSESDQVCPDSLGPSIINAGGVFEVAWKGTEPSANFYEDAHGVDGWNLNADPQFSYYTNVAWG